MCKYCLRAAVDIALSLYLTGYACNKLKHLYFNLFCPHCQKTVPGWAKLQLTFQICGDHACHPERSEGSGSTGGEILRCAQDDSQDTSPVRFREAFSPNIC